jgi:hypothetical protein
MYANCVAIRFSSVKNMHLQVHNLPDGLPSRIERCKGALTATGRKIWLRYLAMPRINNCQTMA